MRWLRSRRAWVAGAAVVLLTGLGWLTHNPRHVYRGASCVYHGAKVEQSIRRHHPGWSAWHVFWAARECR